MHGDAGVTGLIPPIVSAPARLESLEIRFEVLEKKVDTVLSKITPNGGNTNEVGDVLQRIAKHLGEWAEDPTLAPKLNRRKTDRG